MSAAFQRFIFSDYVCRGRQVLLHYRLEGPAKTIDFEETLDLPEPIDPAALSSAVGQRLLQGWHLVGGISYWKTFCPPNIVVASAALTAADAAYWQELYTFGLGEFFYRNRLDPREAVHFPVGDGSSSALQAPALRRRSLALVGGGKDSAVSIEMLRQAERPFDLFFLGEPGAAIQRTAAIADANLLVVRRRLDPQLFALNQAGALNGHVPISAMIAHVSHLVACLLGHDSVIASNEASASYGNVLFHGLEINHQWSKSLRFEQLFRAWCQRQLLAGSEYLSLLRPLTELRIAKAFASQPKYFSAVTSCNKNFRLQPSGPVDRWCGTCPKCLFVFTAVRPFVSDDDIKTLFGRSFFATDQAVSTLAELAGQAGHKPFECVGTPEEVLAALSLIEEQGKESATPVMAWFRRDVLPTIMDRRQTLIEQALALRSEHCLSSSWLAVMYAYLRNH